MQDTFDVTTVIFLALAVFVIWRLRSVLGQKTGRERPPFDPFARRDSTETMRPSSVDNVVRLPTTSAEPAAAPPAANRWAGLAEDNSAVARGLDDVVRQEPSFDPAAFLDGAKSAYEAIVTAFAKGDRATLKSLLSKDVFDGFERAIADREKRGDTVETTFVSIDKPHILTVESRNRVAQVTLRLVSKLITATRNAAGEVIDGSAEAISDVTDIWTFARTLGSRDPNWQLVATEAGH